MRVILSIFALALPVQEPAEKAASDLAAAIEKGINAGDASSLGKVFDVDALIDRVLKDLPLSAGFKAGYREGVRKSFSMGGQIVEALKEEPGYHCLRVRTVDGTRRAQFRMLIGSDFNYHEHLLDVTAAGRIRIIDTHVGTTGEWLSETLRRTCLAGVAAEPGALGKLVGRENEYVKNLPRIQTMQKLHAEGKNAEALKVFASLPESVQKEKVVLTTRISIAAAVSPEEWIRAVEDLKKAYPGDPCVSLHSIAPLTQMKQYDKAIQALEDLDKSVGGDPYLQYQRSEVYLAAGNVDKALEHARKAVEQEKTLAQGYWMQVTISLQRKQYAETAKLLTTVEQTLGVEMTDLTKVDIYKEFAASPEHAAWLESRKK